MKTEQAVMSKLIELEGVIRRYEKKGDFTTAMLFKRDIHILKWVLEDEE